MFTRRLRAQSRTYWLPWANSARAYRCGMCACGAARARSDFLFRTRAYMAPLEPDARLYTRHHTTGGRNFQKLSDPELDKLLEAQRREMDVAKRKEVVMKAQERLWDLYPQVWLHTRETYLPNQGWVVVQPSVYRRWGEPASVWLSR